MAYPNYQEWLDSLSSSQREAAIQLTNRFRMAGAPEPESWARSEVSEDIPQLARYLFLKELWPTIIDRWQNTDSWIDFAIDEATKFPRAAFADAGSALARLRQKNVSDIDIAAIARMVAYQTVFSILYRLSGNFDLGTSSDWPGWLLAEIDREGKMSGREVGGLHETLLSLDPTGREGSPEKK